MSSRVGVILADRSLSVRAVLRRLLEQASEIEVIADSDDGREVVRLAAEKTPAAIILDLDLPSLSGRALIKRITAGGRVPIFVLTPKQNHQSTRAAMSLHSLGVVAVFPKPESPSEWNALGKALCEAVRHLGSEPWGGRGVAPEPDETSVISRELRYVAVGASTGGPGAIFELLAGLGRIAFDVAGTVAQPLPSGEVTVKNGTFEQFVAGTLIENLDLSATVDRAQIIKITLSGNDGGTGRISGDGSANLSDLAGKPIEVTVKFDQATLVRRDDVTASATGSVGFSGTATRGRLAGKITTDRVDVRLVNKLPPSVVTLDVTEVNAKGEPRSGKEAAKPAEPSQIDLDLTVDLPKQVYVNGRGLESEWSGSFRITGTTGTPIVEGSLSVERGQVTFAGKRFELTKGVVTLDGGTEIEPRIDIVAEYTQDDFTANITIAGKASDPKLTLSSSPPLPQEEILPRVLFGKNASQLSALEAAQLAIAVQGLTSGGPGVAETLLSGVQDTLGINVLSVESAGEDGQGTALRAGKHIGDRVYVETVQGTQPGSTSYRVEVKIIDNLSAISSVGQGTEDASGFLGLQWKYRY